MFCIFQTKVHSTIDSEKQEQNKIGEGKILPNWYNVIVLPHKKLLNFGKPKKERVINSLVL